MVCTSLGSLLRPLFYFLCSILLIHRVQDIAYTEDKFPTKVMISLRGKIQLPFYEAE